MQKILTGCQTACILIVILTCELLVTLPETMAEPANHTPQLSTGIVVVLGLPVADRPESLVELTDDNELLVYFQSDKPETLSAVRSAAESSELLGKRIFVEQGKCDSIHFGANLADQVLISQEAAGAVSQEEILRVLHPGGIADVAGKQLVKPNVDGVDHWTHVYHGPDNNPQSTDQTARAPYRTHFLGGPMFSPMPEVTVAAGGRVFRAFGHIAHKENQNAMLNSLLCTNAYNGTILWRRPLHEGFMIHRNTMIATPDSLYLGDDESCKVIDAATGEIRDEIKVPNDTADGPVWKWMAMKDGILFALVGAEEVKVKTLRSQTPGLGHWPWGMWKGHEYGDPRTNFGFGRTFLAIDLKTKKTLWTYRDEDYIDSRGVCMNDSQIIFYCPDKFLGSLNLQEGTLQWKNSNSALLQFIGPNEPAQHYVTGYSTTGYIKCNQKQIFFAGPQRRHLVAVATDDGRLLWQKLGGNLQLVLRDDGIYCAGPQFPERGESGPTGVKLSYDGEPLATFPSRRACTRATGSVDSIFFRTTGGTVRVDVATNRAEHIAPMRPPCQDGVIISDGLLFWGPWMCGCQLSLYGHVCLAPLDNEKGAVPTTEPQLITCDSAPDDVAAFPVHAFDWPSFQHDNQRTMTTQVSIPTEIEQLWAHQTECQTAASGPVLAGSVVFVGDHSGSVRALDATGQVVWKMPTSGPVYYPPTVSDGRVFAGSGDGRVYAWEATTGRPLWTYRIAPQARWIPAYGRLISTWPVAGGVVVHNGVLYAAAGIAHYDGTYVVALDATTGQPKWKNDTTGALAKDVNCGISLQGELKIIGNELQFLAGGAYHTARFDLATGRCLNTPSSEVTSRFRTAFNPFYPDYGRYTPLHQPVGDGKSLDYQARYDFGVFHGPGVIKPPPPGQQKKQGPPQRFAVWEEEPGRRYTGFAVGKEIFLGVGHLPNDDNVGFILAKRIDNGKEVWRRELPAAPVKGGVAIDHRQQIVVSLDNGQVICFGPKS